MNPFQKASKKQAKLRATIFGPSGSGKSFTSLRIATGIIQFIGKGRIAGICTERKSLRKYSDRFDFDVLDLEDKTIDGYCKFIKLAGEQGIYEVLIIDSLSHAWQELLEQVERIAKAKYKGNTWSAWSEGTPEQRRLVDAILDFPGHVIVTMRSKTEWTTGDAGNGKSKPVRVGLAPEQGKGIEYEFDLLLEMTVDHVCNVLKDRTGKFQDKLIDQPGEDFGKSLCEWLSEGEVIEPKPELTPTAPPPELNDEDKRQGNIKKLRAILEKQRGKYDLADFEQAFCLAVCEGCEDKTQRTKLEQFNLEEARDMLTKNKEIISQMTKLANGAPVA